MSLRIRLFLVLGALVAALVLAHGWLVRSLAGELTAELDVVALDVGEAVARALSAGEPTCTNPPCPEAMHQVRVLHIAEKEKKTGPLPPAPLSADEEGGEPLKEGLRPSGSPLGAPHHPPAPLSADEEGGEPSKEGLRPSGSPLGAPHLPPATLSADEEGGEPLKEGLRPSGSPLGAPRLGREVGSSAGQVSPIFSEGEPGLPSSQGEPEGGTPSDSGSPPSPSAERGAGGRGPAERIVVRKILRGEVKDGKGYSYYYTAKTGDELPPGEIQHEQLVIKLGDPAQGALHLRGPGLAAEVPIPRLGLQEKLAEFERRILAGSAILLLAGLLAAAYLAHRVSAPLLRLSQAAVAVGGGDFGAAVDERAGSSEVRDALRAFNRMSSRLSELSQQNRRLLQERHLGEIGEIARGLAHSLRNPLHALGLSVDEIASLSSAGELAAAARRQIGKLDRNIRSFLVFASQGDAHPQPVDLGALAEDVALEALQDRHSGVRVEVEKKPGDLTLPAVEQELRAIVQALLVNAIEASPPGETVVLRALPGELPGRLRIEVEDRGEGLAPEVRERLFTPHVTTKASGSGMGLFLAQRLAAGRYDGSLELQDRDGGGTRAILELGARIEH